MKSKKVNNGEKKCYAMSDCYWRISDTNICTYSDGCPYNEKPKKIKPKKMKPTKDYKLIPMFEITDEAREIAVAWMECEDKHWIRQKHKLASDIMNYAESFHKEKLREELILFASQRNEQHFLDWESKYMITVNEINDFLNTKE